MNVKKWQFVSYAYGPMGWHTARQKADIEKRKDKDGDDNPGYWRPVSDQEQREFTSSIGQLAHEQG